MAGWAKLQAGDDKVIKDCSLWNGERWEAAKAPFNRYSKYKRESPKFIQGVNPGIQFVEEYKRANPGVKVGIVCWARGGTKIEEWHPDSKKWPLYEEAVKQAKSALSQKGELKWILWHQGESNSKNVKDYPALLKAHVERLREEFKTPNLPFVFGQIGHWQKPYKEFNEMIIEQTKAIPYTACVTAEGLTSFDPYHFDRKESIRTLASLCHENVKIIR